MSTSDTACAFAARGKSIANPAPADTAPNCRRVSFVARKYSVLSGHCQVNSPPRHNAQMHPRRSRYLRHRFPSDIISHAVWLYHRYGLSFRDVEDLLAERGVIVSYETIRQWCAKFGPEYARR